MILILSIVFSNESCSVMLHLKIQKSVDSSITRILMQLQVTFVFCPLLFIIISGVIPAFAGDKEKHDKHPFIPMSDEVKKIFKEATHIMKDNAEKISDKTPKLFEHTLTSLGDKAEDSAKKSMTKMEEIFETMTQHIEKAMKEASESFEKFMKSAAKDSESKRTKAHEEFDEVATKMKENVESFKEKALKLFKNF